MSEEKKSSNIRLVSQEAYTSPKVTEVEKKGWVAIGEDNNYYQFLIDLYMGSPTNNAAIMGTAQQVYGKGLKPVNSQDAEKWLNFRKVLSQGDLKKTILDFKMLGEAAFHITMTADRNKIYRAKHFPRETLRPSIANDKGEIDSYFYCSDWSDKKKADNAESLPVFGVGAEGQAEYFMIVRTYSPGLFYYSPVDYQGGTQWAELEIEVSNFYLNYVKNGMYPQMLINFNNGIPEDRIQSSIERKIKNKFSSTNNSGKFILAFNDNKEQAATLDPVQLADAPAQFEFLSKEVTEKVLLSHRITSPMLLGIKSATGLGNNADELRTAHLLYTETVVEPNRDPFREAIDNIMIFNNSYVPYVWEDSTPVEFEKPEQPQQLKKVELTKELDLDGIAEDIISKGTTEEDLLNEYDIFNVDWADGETSEENIEARLNEMVMLNANQDSYQDGEIFKVRYLYKKTSKDDVKDDNHRPLCSKLLSASLIYRKEDITAMSSNGGAEDKGEEYDVFLHKGGVNCQHGWERRIYRKKLKKDGEAWGGGAMNGVKISRIYDAIRGDANISQSADKKAYKAPRDTPKNGHK